MLVALTGLLLVGVAGPQAGEVFRLEVGPPIAAPNAPKKSAFVVRSQCCEVSSVTITATAEGIVNGARKTVPLTLMDVGSGARAVPSAWGEGTWVVRLDGSCAERKTVASTIVPMGRAGFMRDAVITLTRAATAADVDAALRSARGNTE
jgi:hypothetical protein